MPLGHGGKLAVEYPGNSLHKLHKQAFQQHVLRSDHRDGQKRHTKLPVVTEPVPPHKEGVVPLQDVGNKAGNRSQVKTPRLTVSTYKAAATKKGAENGQEQGQGADVGDAQKFQGFVEMVSGHFCGVVRCGFSEKCDGDKAAEFEKYLKNVCPWQKRSLALHGATVIGVPVREEMHEEDQSQEQWDPAVAKWPFLKKFPKTAQPRKGPDLGPSKDGPAPPTPLLPQRIQNRLEFLQRAEIGSREIPEEESVCSDVEKLLQKMEKEKYTGAARFRLPISKIVFAVPDLTAARWRIWLQGAGEGPTGLARRLDDALRKRSNVFQVTPGGDDGAEVSLVNRNQPLSSSAVVWLDLLPALHVLGPLAAHVGDAWSSNVDLAGFIKVARAMERAASLNLTKITSFGPVRHEKFLMSNGTSQTWEADERISSEPGSSMTPDLTPWDQTSAPPTETPWGSSSSNTTVSRTRRAGVIEDENANASAGVNSLACLGKLEAKWLDNCLNEQSDDEEHADGNAVQHLYNAVTVHFGNGGSYTERSKGSKEIQQDMQPGISEEVWVKMCQWHPQLSHLEKDTNELFNAALKAWNTVVVQQAEPTLTVPPLLFSLLLQEAARRRDKDPDELVRELLWRHCHWDFPGGRKLLRQLKRVFDNYARGGTLNQAGFLRLAQEVGIMRNDPRAGVREKLARAYAVQMKSTAPAPFAEFVRLLEYVSSFLRNTNGVKWDGPWPLLQKVADSFPDS